jgi:hypothetical protein
MANIDSASWNHASYAGLGLEASMLALFDDCAATQKQTTKQEIESNSEKLERLRAEVREALKQAENARENAGFWGKLSSFFGGDVAKLAQLCAAVAVVAGSGGTGVPLVLAGMACLTAAEIGRQNGLDPKLCTALSLAGAGLCFFAGAGVANTATKASSVFSAIGGGAQATGSAASIAEGQWVAEAERADARAQLTNADQEQIRVLIEEALDRLQEQQSDTTRAHGVAAQALQEQHYGRQAVISNF